MTRTILILSLAALLAGPACERGGEKSDTQTSSTHEAFERDLDRLRADVEASPDDEVRASLYQAFLERHADHPGVAEVRTEYVGFVVDRTREDVQSAVSRAQASTLREGYGQMLTAGEVAPLRGFALLQIARSKVLRDAAALETPVHLPKLDGGEIALQRPVSPGLGHARGRILKAADDLVSDLMPSRCNTYCANEVFNRLLRPALGGDVFVGPGQLDPKVLKVAVDKAWVEPDTQLMGFEARDLYAALLREPLREYARVHAAMKSLGWKKIEADYRKALDPKKEQEKTFNREMIRFYRAYPAQSGLAERPELDAIKALHVPVGFWMRRRADASEPVLASFLERVFAAYDPQFAAKL